MSDELTSADQYPVVRDEEIELPSGARVRVRKPSMFAMLRRGQLPPEVREIVMKMDADEEVTEQEVFTLLDCLVAAAFVSPKVTFKRKKGAVYIEDISDEDRTAVIKAFGLREMV